MNRACDVDTLRVGNRLFETQTGVIRKIAEIAVSGEEPDFVVEA